MASTTMYFTDVVKYKVETHALKVDPKSKRVEIEITDNQGNKSTITLFLK